jgi:hypothetical protein
MSMARAARFLETVQLCPEILCGSLSAEVATNGDMEMNTRHEGSSRRQRSETANGRCNPSHGKGAGSHFEDNLQGGGRQSRDGVDDFVALAPKLERQ